MKLSSLIINTSLLALSIPACGQGLKDAYRDYWRTSVSVNQWEVQAQPGYENKLDYTGFIGGDQTAHWSNVEKHFDWVVAENCMKCEVIHPQEGVYDFTLADQFVDKALASGLKVMGHCLIWHSQCAKWFHYDKDGKLVSKEVLKKRMKEHITTVMSHFKGRVSAWDVVNEAFEDDASPRNSLFYQILGTDYIPLAFQYAHEADPTAELYYNDFSMNKPQKIEGVVEFFRPLIEKGLPVTAIGLQGHMILEDNVDNSVIKQYDHSIKTVATLGIPAFFSELDLSVLPNPYGFSGANVSDRFTYTPDKDPFKDGLTKLQTQKMNLFWVDFYKMLISNKENILRVGFWCVNDANSWRNDFPIKGRTDYATLFNRDNSPKECVNEIINLVKPQCCQESKSNKKQKK